MDPVHFDNCAKLVHDLKASKYNWPIIAKVVHYKGESRYTNSQQTYFNDPVKQYPSKEWFLSTTKKSRTEFKIYKDDGSILMLNSDSYLTLHKLNYFNGWHCNLGVDLIKIFADGTITGNCQQLLYGIDTYYKLYDVNFTDVFNPKIRSVICSQKICGCHGEIIINKWKNNDIT
jgi:hypothetical protein